MLKSLDDSYIVPGRPRELSRDLLLCMGFKYSELLGFYYIDSPFRLLCCDDGRYMVFYGLAFLGIIDTERELRKLYHSLKKGNESN